jgi:hypothetical protein
MMAMMEVEAMTKMPRKMKTIQMLRESRLAMKWVQNEWLK